MKQIAILGLAYGDEGKGRIVHDFSLDYDWVIRYSGSSNAGHTIYRDDKKYVHNLLPSADHRNQNIKSFLGAGMVINPDELLNEVKRAEENFPGIAKTIYIDPDAFIVSEEHIKIDKEKNKNIGTTGKGIGPAYVEKMSRAGVKLRKLIEDNNPTIEELKKLGVNFTYVYELYNHFKQSNLIFEGAQSILLDLNLGTYPYVTCGEAGISGIYSSGFGFAKLDKVYGVSKAYSTRVGSGPFPTEIFGREADELRQKGKEYGATTGRPRRIGWADFVLLKYAAEKAGVNSLIITKFDILNGIDYIPVATSYMQPLTSSQDLFNAEPVYQFIPKWQSVGDFGSSKFVELCEETTGIKVEYVSWGVKKEELIQL